MNTTRWHYRPVSNKVLSFHKQVLLVSWQNGLQAIARKPLFLQSQSIVSKSSVLRHALMSHHHLFSSHTWLSSHPYGLSTSAAFFSFSLLPALMLSFSKTIPRAIRRDAENPLARFSAGGCKATRLTPRNPIVDQLQICLRVAQRDTLSEASDDIRPPRSPVPSAIGVSARAWTANSENVLASPRMPCIQSAHLGSHIKACRTWQELSDLVDRHGSQFNFIHASSAMTHLAQLRSAGMDTAEASSRSARPSMLSGTGPESAPMESSMHWGEVSSSDYADLAVLVEDLLLLAESHMHQFGARQATNVLWSLAYLNPLHPAGCTQLAAVMLPLMRYLLPWCALSMGEHPFGLVKGTDGRSPNLC